MKFKKTLNVLYIFCIKCQIHNIEKRIIDHHQDQRILIRKFVYVIHPKINHESNLVLVTKNMIIDQNIQITQINQANLTVQGW